jgi:hypothetical protein
MHNHLAASVLALVVLPLGAASCSSGSAGTKGTGGNAGATSATGGAQGTGGAGGKAPGTGGANASGTGGANASGTGGALETGGAGGKANGTGGVLGTGGVGGKANAMGGSGTAGSTGSHSVILPVGNAPFDYQIGGAYPPPAGVTIVSRDRGDAVAPGIYNICYVNGFQIQPGEAATWMASHADLILKNAQGQAVIDPDWNEMLVDTSSPSKRDALLKVVGPWIDDCAAKGFNAVEIDNLDSSGRSKGLLTEENNVALMGLLSARAHGAGLAAGQKNASALVARKADLGTDFAVAEECNRYSECDVYKQAYGTRVFVIEHRREDFTKGCTTEADLSIVLRDLEVTKPGSGTYVFDGC